MMQRQRDYKWKWGRRQLKGLNNQIIVLKEEKEMFYMLAQDLLECIGPSPTYLISL